MKSIEYRKDIPIIGKLDIVVCGGGPGGIGAAIAAAERGAKVALIERLGFLGGMATAGLVNPMSEFAYNGERITGGIPYRLAQELIEAGGGQFEQPRCNLSFNPEKYKLVAQRMALRAGVILLTNTTLVDCVMEGVSIKAVVASNRDGIQAVEARYFVDATGDACLAHMAGVEMLEETRPMQPGTLCFTMSGVDTATPRMHIIHQANHRFNHQAVFIRDALQGLREAGEKVPQFGGPWLSTVLQLGSITMNFTRSAMDSSNNRSYNDAEQKMMEDVFTLSEMIKRVVPEFKNAYVSSVATVAGTRQGRRIHGAYVLTGKDYLDGIKFKDSIARACHPVDIHLPNDEGQSLQFPKTAGYIPYRSLFTDTHPNLLIAGRAISADEDAFAAVRVQAPCMEIGQAAGFAAALCLNHGGIAVNKVDHEELVSLVKKAGSLV